MIRLINKFEHVVHSIISIIIMVVLAGATAYFLYRFLRRPLVTGDPHDVPRLVQPIEQTFEQMTKMVTPSEREPKEEQAP